MSAVADLDLDEIRALLEQPHAFHVTLAAGKLLAEVERLQRLAGPIAVPSESADERAAVVEHCDRIAALEQGQDRLRTLLGEVLDTFRQVGTEHMAFASVRIETLARWLAARGAS